MIESVGVVSEGVVSEVAIGGTTETMENISASLQIESIGNDNYIEGTNVFENTLDYPNISDANESTKIDAEINQEIVEQCTPEGVENIRNNYENTDKVLTDIQNEIIESKSPIDFQKQIKRIERYKGTIFENICKESFSDKFESVEQVQQTIETEEGITKPDIILYDAKEDFKIGNINIKEGQDLFVEVKCGKAKYIESEMSHIEKQVLGHSEGKSLVVVTRDYLEIDPQKRANFEYKLSQNGSGIFVSDVYSSEVGNAVVQNIRNF